MSFVIPIENLVVVNEHKAWNYVDDIESMYSHYHKKSCFVSGLILYVYQKKLQKGSFQVSSG